MVERRYVRASLPTKTAASTAAFISPRSRADLQRAFSAVEALPCGNASYRVRPWQEFYADELLELVRGGLRRTVSGGGT